MMASASRAWIAALLGLAAFMSLAAVDVADAAVGKLTLDVNGVKRTAVIVERARLKRVRRPLVIVLHGSNGDGARVRKNFGLDEIVENTGTVLVFPDANLKQWSLTAASEAKSDDIAFLRAIVERLVSQGTVDPKRVFLVGVSNGGMLAMQVACRAPETYAGFASIIANMPVDLAASCKPPRPVPIIMINGTADPRIPYKGGATSNIDQIEKVVSTDEGLKIFADAAACGNKLPEVGFPNRNPKSASRAYLDRFEGCKAPVELVRVEGGGHTIPGRWSGADAGATVGAHNVDIDTAKLVYDFFKKLGG